MKVFLLAGLICLYVMSFVYVARIAFKLYILEISNSYCLSQFF